MELTLRDGDGQSFVEGPPEQPLMERAADVNRLIEACFEHESRGLLLYSENLTERFFDLSSGDAGEILQKLRNYNIRLALVRSPTLRLSQRFEELMTDENQGADFRMFDARPAAEQWLRSS